jgi:hypothetical protein
VADLNSQCEANKPILCRFPTINMLCTSEIGLPARQRHEFRSRGQRHAAAEARARGPGPAQGRDDEWGNHASLNSQGCRPCAGAALKQPVGDLIFTSSPQVHITDVDEGAETLNRVSVATKLAPVGTTRLDMRRNAVQLPMVTAGYIHFGMQAHPDAPWTTAELARARICDGCAFARCATSSSVAARCRRR